MRIAPFLLPATLAVVIAGASAPIASAQDHNPFNSPSTLTLLDDTDPDTVLFEYHNQTGMTLTCRVYFYSPERASELRDIVKDLTDPVEIASAFSAYVSSNLPTPSSVGFDVAEGEKYNRAFSIGSPRPVALASRCGELGYFASPEHYLEVEFDITTESTDPPETGPIGSLDLGSVTALFGS